jgi:hypothetical protein
LLLVASFELCESGFNVCCVCRLSNCGRLPDPRPGGKSGRTFKEFVSKFVPHPVPPERLKELYRVRADLLHGNELVYSDREPLSVGITPAMTQAMTDFDDMRRIAKTVLVNWLAAQNQPQTS